MKKLFLLVLLISLTTLSTAQSKFGAGINAGIASPGGDFGDIYNMGFGGNASLTYDLTPDWQLSASAGYYRFGFNDDLFNDMLKEMGVNETVDVEAPLSIIPIMVGGKYFFAQSDFKPYASVNIGLHIMSVSADDVNIGGQSYDVKTTETQTKGAWAVGLGFLYKVAPKIYLNLDAKFNGNSAEVSQTTTYQEGDTTVEESSTSTTTFITVSAGVQIEL